LPSVSIEVNVAVNGLHCWPDAPDPVAFLRDPHRHTFWIRARLAVTHYNRDVEFFEFAALVRATLEDQYPDLPLGLIDFGTSSCEMIAAFLVEELDLEECAVSEDQEHGAVVRGG